MKKSLLIINKSFELGGIQSSLANMLEVIHDDYDISLAIFNPHGPFLERVPENVKLLKLSPFVEVLGMSYDDCKKYGSVFQRLFKIAGWIWAKIFNNTLPVAFAFATQKNVGEYDVVISYNHESSARNLVTGCGKFALKKCTAKKKLGWIHVDFLAALHPEFELTDLATKRNLKVYKQFDKIIGVSKTATAAFVERYPELEEKCDYCYNVLPVKSIKEKGDLEQDVYSRTPDDIILFSGCRFVTQKGLVPALEKIAPVLKKHKQIKWFIAGSGPKEAELRSLIAENKLEDQVILLGFKQNPFPYIKEADYLFLPSLHETFGMVVGEAHALGTPVIASDIPVMREMVGTHDYLCESNDYSSVLEGLIDAQNREKCFIEAADLSDWKKHFERILAC